MSESLTAHKYFCHLNTVIFHLNYRRPIILQGTGTLWPCGVKRSLNLRYPVLSLVVKSDIMYPM